MRVRFGSVTIQMVVAWGINIAISNVGITANETRLLAPVITISLIGVARVNSGDSGKPFITKERSSNGELASVFPVARMAVDERDVIITHGKEVCTIRGNDDEQILQATIAHGCMQVSVFRP